MNEIVLSTNDNVQIKTERLILRCFDMSDSKALFQNILSDPEVARYMCYDVCENFDEAQKHINSWLDYFNKQDPGLMWDMFSIILKSTNELIGTIDYLENDNEARSAEIGYKIGSSWWRKGYATEATSALIDYLFENTNLNRLWADHDSRNIASGKVLLKSGMLYECTARRCYIRKGHPVDKVSYAIVREDWERNI